MALYFTKHPRGPELSDEAKAKRFRSYVSAADYADEYLPHGMYYLRNTSGTNLWTGIREVEHLPSRFHVDGRGNV